MIKTKNLDDLLDKKIAHQIFKKYYKDCQLRKNFQIKNIERFLVLSPHTYALLYEIIEDSKLGKIRKIRANASREETRIRGYQVMKSLEKQFSGPVFYVPKVYFYDQDYNLLVYENIEGELLVDQLTKPNLDQKLRLASQWLEYLHKLKSDFEFRLPTHEIFFNFSALEKFYPELAKDGLKIINDLKQKLSENYQEILIHGDYQPNNMIIKESQIYIFDFNDSQLGDPTLDLAKFLTQLKVMLFRFGDVQNYSNLEKIFFQNYHLEYNHRNFQIYSKMYFLQILCSLSASLAKEKEAQKTLPEIYQYFNALQNAQT